MLRSIHPKLPMRDKSATKQYYIDGLGFRTIGAMDYDGYLMLEKEGIELHFLNSKH